MKERKTLYWRFRHNLARVAFLRSAYYLLRSIREAFQDGSERGREELDYEFAAREDPWNYRARDQMERIQAEVAMLRSASSTERFRDALEVGCAEGLFTEQLAPLCDRLLAVDISPVALGRARRRLQHAAHLKFALWDMRQDRVPGKYDLIVVIHALEYVRNPLAVRRARNKLVSSLRPGGYLLVGTMNLGSIYEDAWWARFLLRSGTHINRFFARHLDLSLIQTSEFQLGDEHRACDVLLRKKQ